jgi:hypothetical protein
VSLTSKIQLSPFVSNFRIQPGQKNGHSRSVRSNGREGIDFVCCRICGERRRVISGRHLSKHGTDRETYMEEYGLSPDELIAKDFRRVQSSRGDFRPYSKRELIEAIKTAYKRNPRFLSGNVRKTHRQLYHQSLWLFGSWDDALRAAGLDPELRRRKSWNRESVVRKIRALRQKNVPLAANYVMKNHCSIFDAAMREYGSWSGALIAAGVIKNEIPRKTRLGLLRELRDLMEQSNAAIPEQLKIYLTHYFGSLRNAIAALNTDRKLLGGWSKRKIIAVLARMHRSKEKLNYARVRRDNTALVSAAEAYFKSWGRALYAAGIDPSQYFVHHRWRKPRATVRARLRTCSL